MSKSGMTGLYGNSVLNFLRKLHNVFQFSFAPTMHKASLFSTFSLTFISYLFDNNHSNRCQVISLCVLTHIYLLTSDVKEAFHVSLTIWMSSLDKCIFSYSAHFQLDFFCSFFGGVCFAIEL